MEDQPKEPCWEHLPRRPDLFFELKEGFDRRDLKRAYNRLVRQYKPERAPEEFKRIRSAFEALEEGLRYSQAIESSDVELDGAEWAPSDDEPGPDRSGVEGEQLNQQTFELSGPSPYETLEQLAESTPMAVAEALREYPDKSPQNWCQLALIEDELSPQDGLAIYRTLIAGARETEFSLPVMSLLVALCEEPLATQDAKVLVEELAELHRNDRGRLDGERFFYISSELWMELGASLSFEAFEELFERHRQQVDDEGSLMILQLLIRLLPVVGLESTDAWIGGVLAMIEERYHELPPWLQDQVVHSDWLLHYRAVRADFIAGNPLRAKVDRLLMDHARNKRSAVTRGLGELLDEVRGDPKHVLSSFGISGTRGFGSAIEPLWWIAAEYGDSLGGMREPADPEDIQLQVYEFARRLEGRTDRSLLGMAWNLSALALVVSLFVLLIIAPVALIVALSDEHPMLLVGLVIGWSIAVIYAWASDSRLKLLFSLPATRLAGFFSKRLYRYQWRKQVMRFLGQSHLLASDVQQSLECMEAEAVTNNEFIARWMDKDWGLTLYSLALQFDGYWQAPEETEA